MTLDELPTLQAALTKQLPAVELVVKDYDMGTKFGVMATQGQARYFVKMPPTLDMSSLSMPEWLDRVTTALSEQMQ